MEVNVVGGDVAEPRTSVDVQGTEGSRSGHSQEGSTDPGSKGEGTLVDVVADGERRDDPSLTAVTATKGAMPPNGGMRGDGADPGAQNTLFAVPEDATGKGQGAMAQAVRRMGNRPSYGLVTVTSEPLNALIDARLVQPPASTVPDKMRFRKGIHEDTDVPTQEGSSNLLPEGGSTLASNPMALTPSAHSDPSGERKGQMILQGARGEGRARQEELSPVCAEFVARAILGPVVGRVEVFKQSRQLRESCTVPVLLEVDEDASVVCVMRDVATSEVFRVERDMKARRPRAFWVQGLRPARRYSIGFEGIRDSGDRKGVLITPDARSPDLSLVAVSHDRPGELPAVDEINLWASLADRVTSPSWQGVEAVIHVGGQVDLSNAFEDGRCFLESLQTEVEAEAGEVSEEDEALAMEAIKERFRVEYRKVWNQPSTRRVLGSCQHIMMWGCGECRRGYRRQRNAAIHTWAGRRLLRLAKEVFREYQRQLWDPRWGARFKVADHEGFFTTFRWGTVGILALDALDLGTAVVEEGADVGGTKGGITTGGDGSQDRDNETKDDPLLGRRQWEMLDGVLDCEDPGPARADLEEHWVTHPAQQRRLLKRLFAWKAGKVGREVVLLAGAGKREGSMAAETVLELRMPQSPPAPPAVPKETSKSPRESANGGESGVVTDITMGISQVTCGPITAEPLEDSSDAVKLSTKGKVFVPQSEAEKAERRRKPGGTSSAISAEGSAVDFIHLTKPGRNYVVLQVIAETDEEGPIGVVDPAWATSSSLDQAHPSREFDRPPSWWTKRCLGDRTILIEDDVYLKGRQMKQTMECRSWLEASQDFKKAFPEAKASAVDSLEKWEGVCRQVFLHAVYVRVAALWGEEEDAARLAVDVAAEEISCEAKAEEDARLRGEEADAERDAKEMAELKSSDLEAYARRLAQKRADEADRRKREAQRKAGEDLVAQARRESLEKRKAAQRERLALEAKEREAREQEELNVLAETDPVEYDRRIKYWHEKKMEEREKGQRGGAAGEAGAVTGTGGDLVTEGGHGGGDGVIALADLERRKSLARERRSKRRAEMLEKPIIGLESGGNY